MLQSGVTHYVLRNDRSLYIANAGLSWLDYLLTVGFNIVKTGTMALWRRSVHL